MFINGDISAPLHTESETFGVKGGNGDSNSRRFSVHNTNETLVRQGIKGNRGRPD